ncbi:hypothetical protein XENTR_v10007364 [Xenopus tropicalis]|nr:hypothetical protein XENTR_v10007364 [Xenopus tropicalis]
MAASAWGNIAGGSVSCPYSALAHSASAPLRVYHHDNQGTVGPPILPVASPMVQLERNLQGRVKFPLVWPQTKCRCAWNSGRCKEVSVISECGGTA